MASKIVFIFVVFTIFVSMVLSLQDEEQYIYAEEDEEAVDMDLLDFLMASKRGGFSNDLQTLDVSDVDSLETAEKRGRRKQGKNRRYYVCFSGYRECICDRKINPRARKHFITCQAPGYNS